MQGYQHSLAKEDFYSCKNSFRGLSHNILSPSRTRLIGPDIRHSYQNLPENFDMGDGGHLVQQIIGRSSLKVWPISFTVLGTKKSVIKKKELAKCHQSMEIKSCTLTNDYIMGSIQGESVKYGNINSLLGRKSFWNEILME